MSFINKTNAPPETKVVAQSNTSILTTLVIGFLTVYVFKGRIPETLAPLLPGVVAWALGSLAGWSAKHTPRLEEVVDAIGKIQAANIAKIQQSQVARAQVARLAAPQQPRIEELDPNRSDRNKPTEERPEF